MEPPKANLLVTHDPSRPAASEKEVLALLHDERKTELLESPCSGVLLLRVENAKNTVRKLSSMKKESFSSTFRWIPVEKWIPSGKEKMQAEMEKMNGRIGDEESWRLVVHRRHYDAYGNSELVKRLTEKIDRKKVDLENAEKTVVVEIIGDKAGIALLEKEEYLDTQKL